MHKLILLSLAGASFVVGNLIGVTVSFADVTSGEVIVTSELPSSAVVHYEVGQIVTFDLRLSEPFNAGDLEVKSAVRGDVSLLSNSGNNNFSMAGSNGHEMQVTFTANSLGRHYIQFQAVSNSVDRGSRMRAFSIPIQVGPKQPLPDHPGLTRAADGEMVISLKANEDIR